MLMIALSLLGLMVGLIVGGSSLFGIVYRYRGGWCTSKASMKGKVVIVTGASSGIGLETARDLARRGARVIMACRNLEKANRVAEFIKRDTGSDVVEVQRLDTSSLASVRYFADRFLRKEKRLDVLILNAGKTRSRELIITEDGLEQTMATNYFGHFLLTNLLLGVLKESAPSRIVSVSSFTHKSVKTFDMKHLTVSNDEKCHGFIAYTRSKLCNVLLATHLSEILSGTGVVANSLCPGFVYTPILQVMVDWHSYCFRFLGFLIAKSQEQGAQTTLLLAVSEETADVSGEYFEDCKLCRSSDLGRDRGLAKKVWEKSEEIVNLQDHERHY